jgi:exonuclease III
MTLKNIFKSIIGLIIIIILAWTGTIILGNYNIDHLPKTKNENHLRVLSMNVSADNVLDQNFQNEIINSNPDIIIVIEWTGNNLNLVNFNAAGYKTVLNHPRKKVHGICILSKLEGQLKIIETPVKTPCKLPLGQFRFQWNDKFITLFAVHAPPPVPSCKGTTSDYLHAISNWLDNGRLNQDIGNAKQGDLTILAGDFNSIPFDKEIKQIKNKGILDSYSLFNLTNQTWKPLQLFLYIFKIDYVLFSDSFKSINCLKFKIDKSDHLGLMSDLELKTTR